jgi:hypothetical protein
VSCPAAMWGLLRLIRRGIPGVLVWLLIAPLIVVLIVPLIVLLGVVLIVGRVEGVLVSVVRAAAGALGAAEGVADTAVAALLAALHAGSEGQGGVPAHLCVLPGGGEGCSTHKHACLCLTYVRKSLQ